MTLDPLPGWMIGPAGKQPDGSWLARASYGPVPGTCPACGGVLGRHGTVTRLVRDTPRHGRPVRIRLTRPRYRCRSCGVTAYAPDPHLSDGATTTRRLMAYVEAQRPGRSAESIAGETGLAPDTVYRLAPDRR